MSEQQSQKRGIRSAAQKEMRAREGYEPVPPFEEKRARSKREDHDRE